METKIEKKSETKKEIEVTISIEEMEKYIEKAVKKLSQKMTIKGFRPGHVPRSVVENTVGKEELFEEAAREAVEETYPKIIEENNLFTLSSPEVDLIKCAPGNEMIYRAKVYVMPEITLPDYKKIADETVKKEKKDIVVKDDEIDKAIEEIKQSKAKLQKVDREARKGDAVNLNFKGVFSHAKDKKIEEKNFQIILGREDMNLLEGFEEKILGMKEGEIKTFSIDVPSTGDESKQKIDFEVDVVTVLERDLPEINDDFVKSFPGINNLQEFKEKIKEGIVSDRKRKMEEMIKTKILENIKGKTKIEVPEILAEKELDNMMKNIENQLIQNGSSLDAYLEEIGKKEDELRKSWYKKAEENVSYALILHAVSKEEKIDVTDEEIENEIDRHFKIVGKDKNNEKEESLKRMRSYVHDVIKNQKVFKILSIDD
jgi:trigger factor